jgi:hypothetical protein
MYKIFTSMLLAAVVAQPSLGFGPVVAPSIAVKGAPRAEKVKLEIAKLGVGPEARVKVRLKDKTRLDGYVSEAGEEHFVVTDLKTGRESTVAYPEVVQVQGHNLSKGAKIAIAVGIIAGVIIVLYIVRGAFCDGC